MSLREKPGFDPSESEGKKEEPRKRAIKIIKAKSISDVTADDIRRIPPEMDFGEEDEVDAPVEKQSINDWSEDLRAQVKLKKDEKLSEKDKAREEIKRLFKE